MAASAAALSPIAPAEPPADSAVVWPLSYRLQLPPGVTINPDNASDALDKSKQRGRRAGPQTWWHFYRYRDAQGRKPQVLYSSTRDESDRIARLFLHETVIGFDMEWPWDADKRDRLQDKIGLIQLASESTIALIHIGLHAGTTADELIAPALRAVLEAPHITKVGVGIMNADYARLARYFGLRARAGFELSHLHSLTLHGGADVRADQLTTKLCGLARQVEFHLGLPLWKGSARTSDWSRPLSEQQVNYAADDAYAGLMLFHCMNAKRLAMAPVVPRMPVHGDLYTGGLGPLRGQGIRPLWLAPETPDGLVVTAANFFRDALIARGLLPAPPPPEPVVDDIAVAADVAEWDVPDPNPAPDQAKEAYRPEDQPADTEGPAGSFSMELYRELAGQRLQQCRLEGCKPFMIASNKTLEQLATHRPTTTQELLNIKGIGPRKAELYGKVWLPIIKDFIEDEKEQLKELQGQPPPEQQQPENPPPEQQQPENPPPEQPKPPPPTQPEPQQQVDQDPAPNRAEHPRPDDEHDEYYDRWEWRRARSPVTPAPAGTRRIGRSLEILGGSPALPQTGLSFSMAAAGLEDADKGGGGGGASDSDDGSAFAPPVSSPLADRIKRRRRSDDTLQASPPKPAAAPQRRALDEVETPGTDRDAARPPDPSGRLADPPALHASTATDPPPPPQLRIYRQKLVAFSKMVASRLPAAERKPGLLPDAALDALVALPAGADPRAVPELALFVAACDAAGVDLAAAVAKWRPGG